MGIIGGADGPTVIYVTSGVPWGWIIGAAVVIAGVIAAAIFISRKKKK